MAAFPRRYGVYFADLNPTVGGELRKVRPVVHEASRTQGVKEGRQGAKEEMQYTVVIEESPRNYAAYVPDLPGCIATGASREEVVSEIRQAIRLHIESLREHGEPTPEPRCTAAVVEVAAVAG